MSAPTLLPTGRRERGALCENSAQRGLEAVTMVRDEDPASVWRWLDTFSRTELHIMCIALAAMISDQSNPRELLDWTYRLVDGATS